MKARRTPEVREDLPRQFEGRARLAKLLVQAGSSVDPEDVAEGFRQAQGDKLAPADVLPALFDGEPRFKSAADARELYSNLLGLWDLVAQGATLDLAAPPPRVKVEKTVWPDPPEFCAGVPDGPWVEAAWRYLDACSPKELTRLSHAFDNRQDALVQWLDLSWSDEVAKAPGLTDDAFLVARQICFEVFAVLHLSRRDGWPRVRASELSKADRKAVPQAISDWSDELLFDAETDEEKKLTPAEARAVRALVDGALAALWASGT